MRILPLALAAIVVFCACSRKRAAINGRIVACGNEKVYLEKVLPGGSVVTDSALLDKKGNFRLRIATNPDPTIYFLRSGDNFATLLISPGDKVNLQAIGSFDGGYSVEGSKGSERMLELRNIMSSGISKMDSIMKAFATADQKDKVSLSAAYAEQYYATKRQQINFIVEDPGSIASIYALYQRLPNDNNSLVDGKSDITYYRIVADSAGKKYPSSPYVAALRGAIANRESREELALMLGEKMKQEAAKYPEIEMPDMYGKRHRLSELDGKVVILDFWSTNLPDNALNNAEMKKLWEAYSERGLAVYQVCLDTDKHRWVSAATAQKLPWISVCDLRGSDGQAVQSYNVQSIPANFIIDREGNIAGKNIFGAELETIIKKLI